MSSIKDQKLAKNDNVTNFEELNHTFQSLFVSNQIPDHLKHEIQTIEQVFKKYQKIDEGNNIGDDVYGVYSNATKSTDVKESATHEHSFDNTVTIQKGEKFKTKKSSSVLVGNKTHNQDASKLHKNDLLHSEEKQEKNRPIKTNSGYNKKKDKPTKLQEKKKRNENYDKGSDLDAAAYNIVSTPVSDSSCYPTKIPINQATEEMTNYGWSCESCTFLNTFDRYICKQCSRTNEEQKDKRSLERGAIPKQSGKLKPEQLLRFQSQDFEYIKPMPSTSAITDSQQGSVEDYKIGEDPYDSMSMKEIKPNTAVGNESNKPNNKLQDQWKSITSYINYFWFSFYPNKKIKAEILSSAKKPWEFLDEGIQKKYRKVVVEFPNATATQAQNAAILMHFFPQAEVASVFNVCRDRDIKDAFNILVEH